MLRLIRYKGWYKKRKDSRDKKRNEKELLKVLVTAMLRVGVDGGMEICYYSKLWPVFRRPQEGDRREVAPERGEEREEEGKNPAGSLDGKRSSRWTTIPNPNGTHFRMSILMGRGLWAHYGSFQALLNKWMLRIHKKRPLRLGPASLQFNTISLPLRHLAALSGKKAGLLYY